MAEAELKRASTLDGVRFTAQVLVPNLIQGLFRRRPRAVAVAAKLGVDRQAVGFVGGLKRRYGPGPVWIRAAKDEALLVFSEEDIRRVLEGAPAPFAADPEAKRRGMSHFQPDALTISRGALWENRRRFNEAVLDTGMERLTDRFAAVCAEEAAALDGEVGWDRFNRAIRRITRRIVLGDRAADDEELSTLLDGLMEEANKLPKERSDRLDELMARVGEHVAAAEPGSLVSLFGEAPSDSDTKVEGQVPHWLFAMGDTLAINAFRALALIATHPGRSDDLGACLQEAMRLWPTTPLLSRETVEDVSWNGETVPAGTQVLIYNTFNHRDPERHEFADRFAPEAWIDGDAAADWSFNHLSHGPQGCPGGALALFVGKAVLADLVSRDGVELLSPTLDPAKPLPHTLDFFSLRFRIRPPQR